MIRTCTGTGCSNICDGSNNTCIIPVEDTQAEQTLECNAADAPNTALVVGSFAFCNRVAPCPQRFGPFCLCCKLRKGIRNINLVLVKRFLNLQLHSLVYMAYMEGSETVHVEP